MEHIPDGERSASSPKKVQLMVAGRAIALEKRAVWEETKQYTWWLLVIAIALMILATSIGLKFTTRAVAVLVGLFVGFVLAMIAFRVVRRESAALARRLQAYRRLLGELELEEPACGGEDEPEKGLSALVGGLFCAGKMRTSDWYQATFLLAAALYGVGFIALLVYAIQK